MTWPLPSVSREIGTLQNTVPNNAAERDEKAAKSLLIRALGLPLLPEVAVAGDGLQEARLKQPRDATRCAERLALPVHFIAWIPSFRYSRQVEVKIIVLLHIAPPFSFF
jgi:hypothetical protein